MSNDTPALQPEPNTLPPAAPDNTATLPPVAVFTDSPAEPREAASAAGPPQVPGYQIERELGRGGMGVVYKARQVALGRTVAIKMVLAGGHAGADDLARFKTEAEAVAQLQHANVVQLFEAGSHGGLPYFTLEFVSGGSLADRLRGTPLPPQEAARLVEQLARGVQHAHERGVVHRDLKPHNVLLAGDGTPKVTDFGLARRVEVGSGLTATGAVMGTPSYMAPEQASGDGKRVGPAADVWALGAILYECLTGRPPFQGPTPLDTVLQVVSDEPVAVRQLQPKAPADLETICLKCLQKEPGRRYGSAETLADDLRRYLAGEPITARPVGRLERGWRWCKRNPAVAALLATVALTLVGGAVVSAYFAVEAERRADDADASARQAQALSRSLLATQAEREKARTEALGEAARARAAEKETALQRDAARRELDRARRNLLTAQLLRAAGLYRRSPQEALDLLNDTDHCPPELRDFAWRFYAHECRKYGPVRLASGTGRFATMTFSPDGSLLACAADGGVAVLDVRSGLRRATFRPGGHVRALVFMPDGRTLLAHTGEELARLDLVTGATVSGPRLSARCLALSPDGRRVALGDGDAVVLADTDGGKEVARLAGLNGEAAALAFAPGGWRLAAASTTGVCVWDVAARKRLWRADHGGLEEAVQVLTFSADGTRLAGAGYEGPPRGVIRVWNAGTGDLVKALTTPGVEAVVGLAFGRRGELYSCSSGPQGWLRVWDSAAGEILTLRELLDDEGFLSVSFALALSPDGRTAATATGTATLDDYRIELWDVSARRAAPAVRHPKAGGRTLGRSPDGKLLALSGDRVVRLVDAMTGAEHAALRGHDDDVCAAVFLTDGKTLASAAYNGQVIQWDAASGKQKASFKSPSGVLGLRTLPRGRGLVWTGNEGARLDLWIWEAGAPAPRAPLGHEGTAPGAGLDVHPDGKQLAVGGLEAVLLWDLATGKVTRTLRMPEEAPDRGAGVVYAVAYSPDGKTLAASCLRGTVRLWDVETGRELLTARGHPGSVRALAFSPDGATLATGVGTIGHPGEVRAFDAATGQERLALTGLSSGVAALSFGPGGRSLACLLMDGTLHLWEAP